MTLVTEISSPTLFWFVGNDLTLGQSTRFWRPLGCFMRLWCHPSLRPELIFNAAALYFLTGRLPREHFADNLGDPQWGWGQWDNNHTEWDSQLHLHDVWQLGGSVQEAQRCKWIGPPQPGQGRALQENPSAETIVAAQNKNPWPNRRERHRQVVADYIPLRLLTFQHYLLALLCPLTHCAFYTHLCLILVLEWEVTFWCDTPNAVKSWTFLVTASADFGKKAVTQTVQCHMDLPQKTHMYRQPPSPLNSVNSWETTNLLTTGALLLEHYYFM